MGSKLNLEHLGGLNLKFRAVSIQKVVVGEMASTDHRCNGGGELHTLVPNRLYALGCADRRISMDLGNGRMLPVGRSK